MVRTRRAPGRRRGAGKAYLTQTAAAAAPRLPLLPAAPAVPVLLPPASPGRTPNAGSCGRSRRLRFSSANPGNDASADDVVPQLDGVLVAGQPADHRAEEGDAALGRPEVQDRRPDVLAGQGQRLVGLRADLRRRRPSSSSASASSAGRPTSARIGSTNSRVPRRSAVGRSPRSTSKMCGRARRRAGRPPRGRARRGRGRPPAAAAARRCAPPRTRAGSARRSRRRALTQPQRDEPPLDVVVPLGARPAGPTCWSSRRRGRPGRSRSGGRPCAHARRGRSAGAEERPRPRRAPRGRRARPSGRNRAATVPSARDEPLLEVPPHGAGLARGVGHLGELPEHRVRVRAVDVDLAPSSGR